MRRFSFVRVLRTASSERFLIASISAEEQVGAVDLHFLASGRVAGTVFLDGDSWGDEDVDEVLRALDDQLLPDVTVGDGNLVFTVIRGDIVGNFESRQGKSSAKKAKG